MEWHWHPQPCDECPRRFLDPFLQFVMEGSANINQRSQDGGRDTEIAMGAFQPNFQPPGRGMVRILLYSAVIRV